MDYGFIGSVVTVIVFVSFVGIVLWAMSKKAKPGFDEAANLVFDDEKTHSTKQKDRESSINE